MGRLTSARIRKYGASRGLLIPSNNLFVPGANFTLEETGNNQIRTLCFSAKAAQTFTLTDEAGAGQYAPLELCTLPEGVRILRMSAIGHFAAQLTAPFIDAPVLTIALGSVAVAAGAALATDKADVLASTAIAATTAKKVSAGFVSVTPLAVPAAAEKIYLNVRVADDAAHATTAGQQLLVDDGGDDSTYIILNVHMGA